MSMKMVSINIEGNRHLPAVKEFLAKEKPEIICLMEVFEEDMDELSIGYPSRIFAPNMWMDGKKMGVAILSKFTFIETNSFYCDGKEEQYLPDFIQNVGTHRPVVVIGSMEAQGKVWQVGATHFTWTPDGRATEQQTKDVERLIEKLKGRELILCGDFNIARDRNENYQKLTQYYRDNIPLEITSTVDPDLHRANKEQRGRLALAVDYLWTTPKYGVNNVRVECGVSDHCALVADIV